jgi:uncharacterized metal-binding protein
MTTSFSDCAHCPFKIDERLCRTPHGKAPENCPTRNLENLTQESLKIYEQTEYADFACQASIQEAEAYADRELGYAHLRPAKTRIEEIAEFAQKMNYRRLGLAFCVGLRREARIVADLYAARNFEIISVICKAGCSDKNLIGLSDEEKIIRRQPEAMCNPVMQALVLNQAKTELNILLGLCVGHDSLFLKEAQAPCTVLAVKDRVLGHNPLAAIYTNGSYYRSL